MCSGPSSILGSNGCTYCFAVVAVHGGQKQQCLPRHRPRCPQAHYPYDVTDLKDTKRVGFSVYPLFKQYDHSEIYLLVLCTVYIRMSKLHWRD